MRKKKTVETKTQIREASNKNALLRMLSCHGSVMEDTLYIVRVTEREENDEEYRARLVKEIREAKPAFNVNLHSALFMLDYGFDETV